MSLPLSPPFVQLPPRSFLSDPTATHPQSRPPPAPSRTMAQPSLLASQPPRATSQFPQAPLLSSAWSGLCVWVGTGGCYMPRHHPPRWHRALPGHANDRSLSPAACQILQPSTACSLSLCCRFYVGDFLLADPALPRLSSRSSRKIPELEQLGAFPRLVAAAALAALGPVPTWVNRDASLGSPAACRHWPPMSQ